MGSMIEVDRAVRHNWNMVTNSLSNSDEWKRKRECMLTRDMTKVRTVMVTTTAQAASANKHAVNRVMAFGFVDETVISS